MLQVVRLVNPGRPDKVIAFDGLPKDLLDADNPRTEKIDVRLTGLGRSWAEFSPIHFPLFFRTINQDKERWQKISNYVRQFAADGTRLMDRLEDMAANLAPDCNSQAYDSDIVPIIKIKQIIVPSVSPEVKPEPASTAAPEVKTEIPAEVKAEQAADVVKKHATKCFSFGRNGKYTPGCPRCEYLKAAAGKKLVNA